MRPNLHPQSDSVIHAFAVGYSIGAVVTLVAVYDDDDSWESVLVAILWPLLTPIVIGLAVEAWDRIRGYQTSPRRRRRRA